MNDSNFESFCNGLVMEKDDSDFSGYFHVSRRLFNFDSVKKCCFVDNMRDVEDCSKQTYLEELKISAI